MFVKGADNVMLERASFAATNPATMEGVQRHLRQFSESGLRTLVMGKRRLTPEEVEE